MDKPLNEVYAIDASRHFWHISPDSFLTNTQLLIFKKDKNRIQQPFRPMHMAVTTVLHSSLDRPKIPNFATPSVEGHCSIIIRLM